MVLTQKRLYAHIHEFLTELAQHVYIPTKVILFGSYVNWVTQEYSDIDLALWHKDFTGVNFMDYEPFVHLVNKYHPI
ncbi:MAG: nucleotidyltransferase domain-containing protein [Cytophagales bacterium]|nr:nucleotidyltransferase domain-containing protein [Cytophagales bacterium]